ncbi:Kip1p [Rhizophagus irregularis DAOM 197198w]|uniref:Kip1p n=1 Tax=Rhizophagus irregularis (strain DAOM 197198w) TaxID=1432141 RepID=A0A015K770_RHIIW|nr:Kip1p [Rhizophagus irregularis DAOM 197198w]
MASTGGGSEKVSVQVVIRVKPLTAHDLENLPTRFQRQIITTSPYATNQIVVEGEKRQVFSFDNVFPPETTQEEIYDKSVENLVAKFIEGFNVTILAYGQTSSGKTHTMGTADNPSIPLDSKGIIPRAMATLFSTINSIHQSKTDHRKYTIKVSFIEIHNEDLIDLLGEGDEEGRPSVQIREDSKGNIYWSGLQEIKVNNVDEVINYLAIGSQHRQVGATDMNEKSSRSHAIFSVTMTQQKLNTNATSPMSPTFSRPGTPSSRSISRAPSRANSVMSSRFDDIGEWVTITSKFHFVDLAGSERLKRTAARGDRAKEGIAINSGLLALGNVISALGDPNKARHTTHIPYRDSKLTRLLQDSLGGNAKTLLIACVSPAEYNVNETVNTLKYANRARNIKNSAVVNQEEMGWNDVGHLQSLVIKLRQENNALKIANTTLGLQQQQQQQQQQPSTSGIVTPGRVTPNLTPSRKNSIIQGRSTPTSGLPGRSTPTSGIPGRSTPTSGIPGRSTPTNGRDTPITRRTSSPLTTFAHGNVQHSKEIEMLEELVQLQRSYAELSQKYAKISAELAAHQDNYDEETHLHGQSSNFVNSAKIEEYEETITSLESKLAMMNAALSHSENLLSEQESKHKEVEESNEHNKNVINSLQNYIKEIETKLEKREIEAKLQTSRSEHPEKFISETVQVLEQRLERRDMEYQELETQYNELKDLIPQETKILLEKLDDRNQRVNQLESRLNLLADELDKLKTLETTTSTTTGEDNSSSPTGEQNLLTIVNLEFKLAELQKSRENTVTELNDVKTKYQSSLDEIQVLQSSLKETIPRDDRSEITTLESKFADLEKTYQKTVTELAETKFKYEECLNVIKDLQSQLDDASLAHNEMIEELHSISSSTPATPMTPMTPITPYTDNNNPKESSSNVSSKSLIHRKVKSLSVDLLNSEKRDNAHAAIVEKLQFELKLFESFHKDKSQSLDAVKHELSRLELNHRETLQIVEELREEIRKRDALAKLEVKSVINSKQTSDRSCSPTSQIDELEIVQRLRGEVEQLKEKQKLAMESIAERENENKKKSEVVEKLESSIRELKEQLRQAEERKSSTNTNEILINELQSRVKELEDKLVKALEFQNKNQISELDSNVQQATVEENEGVLKLREQVSKLQTDIESKSHTIAAILLPDNEHQTKIRRLEGELCEVKEALRIAIEEKNSKFSLISESSSDSNINSFQSDVMISEESSADKLEQNIDENIIALEGTVKELETQLSKAKETKPISSRTSILHDMDPTQKTVNNLEAKLDTLQKVLNKNSNNVQNLNCEQELVASLQSQLNSLKLDIRRKNELIETLKRDLVDKSTLQQMLKEKEAEITFLREQLNQIKGQDIDVQKHIKGLQEQLEKVEANNIVNKALQSELEAIGKEFKNVKGRESLTLERLRILDAEESKLQKDLERLRNVEISQREQISVLEAQLMEQGGQVDKDLIKLRTELALAKESEISEKKTIANLETKLGSSESEVSILQNEIDELKLKENEQLRMIQDRENKLNEVQSSSSSHDESLLVKRLNEEIEQLRSEKSLQHMKIQNIEMKMKHVQEDPINSPLKNDLVELKASEFRLQQKVHELEQQLTNAQGKYQQLQFMRNELKSLQDSESGQKMIIFQLQTQLQETKEAKETVIREWENMKDNFCAQTKLVVTLEGGLQTMMEELNMAKESHAASLKELDSMTNYLTNILEQRDENEKKIKSLENEINLLKDSGKCNNDYISLCKELSNTKKEMETQNETLVELEKQIEALKKERDQYVEHNNQLTRTVVSQKITVSTLESTISDLQSQLEEEKLSARNYQETMTTLGEKLTKVELQLDESKASDEEHSQMVNELKSMLKETNASLVEKEKMVTDKNARLTELEAMVKKTKADLEKAESSKSLDYELQTKVSEIESRFRSGSSSSELKEAQRLADQQLEYIRELEITCDNVKNLTKELEESEAAQAAQAALIEELEKDLQKKEEKLNELTNKLNETKHKLEKVNDTEVYSVDHVKSLESQLKEARERRDEEIKKLKQANKEIEALRKQIDHLRNDATVERLEELESKAKQFVTERNESLVKNGVLESKIYQLQKDLYDFEDAETKHKQRIVQLEAVLETKELEAKKLKLEKADESNEIDSIISQLKSTGKDGNISDNHLAELNGKLETLGYELTNLQTRSIVDEKQIKKEPAQENKTQSTESEVLNKSTDNYAEIQELNKKIAELEEENDGKTQFIDMLEVTLGENEEELSEAKQQLIVLRQEKLELERKIENLKSQLDTVTNEYEEMKTSVKEKEEIESVLAEERKSKKNVEMAYAKLESQVEQLLSKKNKFMCF